MQIAVVFIVLLACACYIAWLLTDTFRHSGDPCRGCNGCAMKDLKGQERWQKQRKSCYEAKKCEKNLVE